MAEPTPGPWTVLKGVANGGGIGIGPELEGIGPHAVVTFNGGESEANAQLIVTAVNCHADLLAVARRAFAIENSVTLAQERELREGFRDVVRAAIARAEGR